MTKCHRIWRQFYFYSRRPVRWLLNSVSLAWRKAGKKCKRGQLSPPLGAGLAAVNMAYTLSTGMLDGRQTENGPIEQFVELILENREFAERQGWI